MQWRKKICRSDYSDRYSAQFEQLREDVETLWGKNTQQTSSFAAILRRACPYETDLFSSGQDTFISASLVRAFKEKKEDLCTGLAIPISFTIQQR